MKAIAALTPTSIKAACSQCNLRELCLPFRLTEPEVDQLDELVGSKRKTKRQQQLYRAGDPFEAIYAIRTGSFKTDVLLEDGREQVTGGEPGRRWALAVFLAFLVFAAGTAHFVIGPSVIDLLIKDGYRIKRIEQ